VQETLLQQDAREEDFERDSGSVSKMDALVVPGWFWVVGIQGGTVAMGWSVKVWKPVFAISTIDEIQWNALILVNENKWIFDVRSSVAENGRIIIEKWTRGVRLVKNVETASGSQ
jgi:hypothetical protein